MKRSVIFGLAACCLAVQTYGQGTVLFVAANITNFLTGALVVPGTDFHVALYWLPDQATTPTSGDFGPWSVACTTNVTVPGGVNAGVIRIDGITPSGAPAWFQIRVWENVLGVTDTWEEAIRSTTGGRGALCGTSNIARIDTADPTTVPPGVPPNTAHTINGFVFGIQIPEPSAISLGVLGLGALLLLRRRG